MLSQVRSHMILIIFGIITISVGGYLLYYGISSLFSETEGTPSSRISRIVTALAGAGIVVIGCAMLFIR